MGHHRLVDEKRASISWGVIFLLVYLMIWMGAIAATLTLVRHGWATPTGATDSMYVTERWGRDFWFLLTLTFSWIVPITALFTIAYPSKGWLRALHLAICFLLLIYFVVIWIIWTIDYRSANLQTTSNARNLFNDDRWCLVNYAVAPTKCIASANSNPATIQEALGINGAMLTVYWMLFAFGWVLVVDICYVWIVYQGAINKYFELKREGRENAQAYQEAPPSYQPPPQPQPFVEDTKVVMPEPVAPPKQEYYFDDAQVRSNLRLPSSYRKNSRRK